MNYASLLIDDGGTVREGSSVDSRRAAHGTTVGGFFSDYAVNRLGFVTIDRRPGSARIRLRPNAISPLAFIGLMHWLADEELDRVLLDWYADDAWQHTLLSNFADRLEIVHHIAAIVGRWQKKPANGEDMLVQPVRTDALAADGPLARVLGFWRDISGTWLGRLPTLRNMLADRYVLFEARTDSEFVFQDFGHGLPACAIDWLRDGIGCRVEEQPDREYGKSCALAYQKTIQQLEPVVEDVDAFVWWPRHGRVRRCYKRVLLPFRARRNRMRLLSVTAEDASIDLRSSRG